MVNLLMSCKCPRACLHVVLRQTDRQTGRGVARAEGDRIIEYIYIYIYICFGCKYKGGTERKMLIINQFEFKIIGVKSFHILYVSRGTDSVKQTTKKRLLHGELIQPHHLKGILQF